MSCEARAFLRVRRDFPPGHNSEDSALQHSASGEAETDGRRARVIWISFCAGWRMSARSLLAAGILSRCITT